eukprot:m.235264 g.235264  ORF g.235264 m.235264 type:complete len:150 (-) comp16042_c0_seq1:1519-1968(-)
MGKTPKKDKKDKEKDEGEDDGRDYDTLLKGCSSISKPLAAKKLTKKIYKGVKKAAKANQICRGVKEVGKAIRKGSKGLCVIAGDISPIDVITHVPVLCEEANVPYVFVPSKQDLGAAGQTKRPTSIILIKKSDIEGYEELEKEIGSLAD